MHLDTPLLLPAPCHLKRLGSTVQTSFDPDTVGQLDPSVVKHPQGYRIRIEHGAGPGKVELRVATEAGLRHGRATLRQLLRQYGAMMPAMVIEDHPSFKTRGVMLDVSRDRVPTMGFLSEIIDRFAGLKLNHLELYTEHTFAYAPHEAIWRDSSPVTAAEARELDRECLKRGIDLAPNQNCFGHLHRWLRNANYQHLAETTGEWKFLRWPRVGPFSLCPIDPASEAFVAGLLEEMAPCFSSGLVNIGCDETFDVGQGRSEAEVAARGRPAVYFEFVAKVCAIARRLGKRPMMWADIALSHPEALDLFPKDAVGLAWGYEPDMDFSEACRRLIEQGVEPWVCPGTSAWLSITGRTMERRGNLSGAAAAHKDGATGYLVTDWGDYGHFQQWPVTMRAIADAAQSAWNSDVEADPRAVSMHALGDTSSELSLAEWLDELGNVDLDIRRVAGMTAEGLPPSGPIRNNTALFLDLHRPSPYIHPVGATLEQWTEVLDALNGLSATMPAMDEGATLLARELNQTLAHARLAAMHAVVSRTPKPERRHMDEMIDLARFVMTEHGRLWMERCRPGGLSDSTARYQMMFDRLIATFGASRAGMLGEG